MKSKIAATNKIEMKKVITFSFQISFVYSELKGCKIFYPWVKIRTVLHCKKGFELLH